MLQKISFFLTLCFLTENLVLATLKPVTTLKNTTSNSRLTRKKRYISFPDGASAAVSICITTGLIGNPSGTQVSNSYNYGIAYNLPNYTWALQHANGFKNPIFNSEEYVQRRSRRDLYGKIETVLEHMGFDGQACIERALCESSRYLQRWSSEQNNMIVKMIKTVFSFPLKSVYLQEPEAVHQYDRVFRRARRDLTDCSAEETHCDFSLLELAFGKFSLETAQNDRSGLLSLPGLKLM